MPDLTQRQRATLKIIRRHIARHGSPPTLRELCVALEIRSTKGARAFLSELERKGYIERIPAVSRGIRLLGAAA